MTIARPFAVGKYEGDVRPNGTRAWRPAAAGAGRAIRVGAAAVVPVVNVNWNGAKAYVRWLSDKTGKQYRLLSEAEWEYAARGGTTTRYSWGDDIDRNRANCEGCGSRWDDKQTAPVGSFAANPFGLYDVHGNVWEWVEDCGNRSYAGAPSDGRAWTRGDCRRRVLRGGSWVDIPRYLRSAFRFGGRSGNRSSNWGFRVARTLAP